MSPLLFLSHRLPYPPNKGDKVRSYHFLAHLAERYRVFLGTFVDDPADRRHIAALRAICADVHVELLNPRLRRVASAAALLAGQAITVSYFQSRGLRSWVRETVRREGIVRALAFSSPMAHYTLGIPGLRCVADFVDVDSAKWAAYATRRPWPVSALYEREARRLLAYERRIAASVDAVVFVTAEETRLFKDGLTTGTAPIATICNGVDDVFFAPGRSAPTPFRVDEWPLVFTGAMDYWPNVDATLWFAREVLPEIRQRAPRARFYIVGMNPSPAVQALARDDAVVVTGRVEDVRPYLQHARVVVAPLRVARGIQNKVLEAMAMAKPIVVTREVADGLSARGGVDLEVAADRRDFAQRVLGLLADEARATRMGEAARACAVANYRWDSSLRRLDALLEHRAEESSPRLQPRIDVGLPFAAR